MEEALIIIMIGIIMIGIMTIGHIAAGAAGMDGTAMAGRDEVTRMRSAAERIETAVLPLLTTEEATLEAVTLVAAKATAVMVGATDTNRIELDVYFEA